MSELSGREIIIKKLSKVMLCSCIDAYKLRKLSAPDCAYCNYVDEVADWHMAEVARIIEPLKKEYTDEERDTYGSYNLLYEDVQETLKRANGGE